MTEFWVYMPGVEDRINLQRHELGARVVEAADRAGQIPEDDDPVIAAAFAARRVARWFSDPEHVYDAGGTEMHQLMVDRIMDTLPDAKPDPLLVGAIYAGAKDFSEEAFNLAAQGILAGQSAKELTAQGVDLGLVGLVEVVQGPTDRQT